MKRTMDTCVIKSEPMLVPSALAPALRSLVERLKTGRIASLVARYDVDEDCWRSLVFWSNTNSINEFTELSNEAARNVLEPAYR
jgi:hypothetical protein